LKKYLGQSDGTKDGGGAKQHFDDVFRFNSLL
jgi:hypothetical protein